MVKRSKKHTILGGIKVSSKQLSEWGSYGGRPQKYSSNAEKQRAYKLRKKQAKFGVEVQLRDYRGYGEVKVKRYITCPNCGTVNHDLRKYFDERGELIPENFWWSLELGKHNIKENTYHCPNCYHAFSFLRNEIEAKEIKTVIPRAGSATERSRKHRKRTLLR